MLFLTPLPNDNHFTFVITISKGIKNILLDILNLIDKSEEFI